jgi:HNH endonuclease
MDSSRARALELLEARSGEVLSVPEIQSLLPEGPAQESFRQSKGIYKPAGDEHALWIRSTLKGQARYRDSMPETTSPDGRWSIEYSAEDSKGEVHPEQWTNRSLLKCRDDHVPVAVFREVAGEGRTAYQVLGVAYVTGWDGHHFTLKGTAIGRAVEEPEVTFETAPLPFTAFDPPVSPVLSSRRPRPNQQAFKERVLWAYKERCALCGFGVRSGGEPRGLDAAHIIPFENGGTSRDVRNGICLCANHHRLFDKPVWGWTLDEDLRLIVGRDAELVQTAGTNCIPSLEGKRPPYLPGSSALWPALEAIKTRLGLFERNQPR